MSKAKNVSPEVPIQLNEAQLNCVLPNGRTIRNSTYEELRNFGECLQAIGGLSDNPDAPIKGSEPAVLKTLKRYYPRMPASALKMWFQTATLPSDAKSPVQRP